MVPPNRLPISIQSWEHLMEVVNDPEVQNRLPSSADADEFGQCCPWHEFIEKTHAQGRAPDNIGVINMPTVLEQRDLF